MWLAKNSSFRELVSVFIFNVTQLSLVFLDLSLRGKFLIPPLDIMGGRQTGVVIVIC